MIHSLNHWPFSAVFLHICIVGSYFPYDYKWCNLICNYNMHLNFHVSCCKIETSYSLNFDPRVFVIYNTGSSVQAHCRKMHWNFLRPFILQTKLCHVFFNRSSMFRKISPSKQSISLAFMFVRIVSSCFITNIRHFFCLCRKYSNLGNYADPHWSPHPVRCHVLL